MQAASTATTTSVGQPALDDPEDVTDLPPTQSAQESKALPSKPSNGRIVPQALKSMGTAEKTKDTTKNYRPIWVPPSKGSLINGKRGVRNEDQDHVTHHFRIQDNGDGKTTHKWAKSRKQRSLNAFDLKDGRWEDGPDPENEATGQTEEALQQRKMYLCSRCLLPKRGHICSIPYPGKAKKREDHSFQKKATANLTSAVPENRYTAAPRRVFDPNMDIPRYADDEKIEPEVTMAARKRKRPRSLSSQNSPLGYARRVSNAGLDVESLESGDTIEARDRTRAVYDGLAPGFGTAINDDFNGNDIVHVAGFKIQSLEKEEWENSKVGL